MKKVVRHIVANITEDTAAVYCGAHVPVEKEEGMGQFPEWYRKHYKQGWGHDQPILVHGQIVVNAMEKKVQG